MAKLEQKVIKKEDGVVVAYTKTMTCREPLVANTTDAAKEKHVPVFTEDGNVVTVTIGSVEHPMIDVHYIEWISIETNEGYQIKELKPNDKPTAKFALVDGEELKAVYAYCNLHGLWKAN